MPSKPPTRGDRVRRINYRTYAVVGFGEAPSGHPASPSLPFFPPSRRQSRRLAEKERFLEGLHPSKPP
jgi:hypothetical protein